MLSRDRNTPLLRGLFEMRLWSTLSRTAEVRDQVADVLVRYRVWIWTALVLAVPWLLWCTFSLKFDSSLEVWFLADDPKVIRYERFRQHFGRDEGIAIGWRPRDLFDARSLDVLADVTSRLQRLALLRDVISLTNVTSLENQDGRIAQVPWFSRDVWRQASATELRSRATTDPMLCNLLLNDELSATMILLLPHIQCSTADQQIELTRQVREIVPPLADLGQVYLSGIPAINDAMFRNARRDLVILSPLVFGMIWLMMLTFVRDARLAILPLGIVIIASLGTGGIMACFGWQINFLISALTLVILVVGVANAVHIISAWQEDVARGLNADDAIRSTFQRMWTPCVMTTLSTCVGFVSLTVSHVRPIRQFGILAAAGTLLAFLLTMIVLPGVLHGYSSRMHSGIPPTRHPLLAGALQWLGRPTRRRNAWILATTALLVPFLAWGVMRIRSTANPLSYFRQHEPVRRDTLAMDRLFHGSATIEFCIEAETGQFARRQTLLAVEDLQRWLMQNLSSEWSMSIVDYLKSVDRIQSGVVDGHIPTRRVHFTLSRMKRLAPERFHRWLDDTFSFGRISVRFPLSIADELADKLPQLEEHLARLGAQSGLRAEVTGYVNLMNDMRLYLLASQIKSLLVAAVTVTAMMCWMLGSIRLGLLSMVPNLLPIALGVAVMGWYGIQLDPGTVMISSVALGLVVDDTVHFMNAFRRRRQDGDDVDGAIATAMHQTGRPIIVTSVVLMVGFMALTGGSFTPTIYFGAIMTVIVMAALIADLMLIPAIMSLSTRSTWRGD